MCATILMGALVAAALSLPARADDVDDEDLKDCATRMSPGSRIDACTDVIDEADGKGHRAVIAYIFRGNAHMDENDFDDAIADMTHAIDAEPEYAGGYMWRCVARARKNDRGAIKDCDRAVELKPTETSVWLTRAKIESRFGSVDDAVDDYTQAIDREPDNAVALAGRGALYAKQNRSDLALVDLNRSLTVRPNSSQAHYDRGMLFVSMHRNADARADFDSAIALEPSFEQAYLGRALTRYDERDYAAALTDVAMAMRVNSKSANAYRVRAMIRTATGDISGAKADEARAAELRDQATGDSD